MKACLDVLEGTGELGLTAAPGGPGGSRIEGAGVANQLGDAGKQHHQFDTSIDRIGGVGAWHHHLAGEAFEIYAFTYRTFAGLFFAGVFIARGFAVAAWTHAIYDLHVMWEYGF